MRGVRRAVPAMFLLGMLAQAHADPCNPDDLKTDARLLGPYTAQCGGRFECAPSDTLTVEPMDKTTQLKRISFELGPGVCYALPPIVASSGQPMHIPLAPIIAGWLAQAHKEPPDNQDPLRQLLTQSKGKISMNVLLNGDKNEHYVAAVMLNLKDLWTEGQLHWNSLCEQCHSEASLNGEIALNVLPNLSAWHNAYNVDYSTLGLRLNSVRIPGVEIVADEATGTLRIRLLRTGANQASWQPIVEYALWHDAPLDMAIIDEHARILTGDGKLGLTLPSLGRRLLWPLFGLLALMGFLIGVGTKNDWAWLRDDYGLPLSELPVRERPYSLGKFQMTFWTFIIVLSTIAIVAVFPEVPSLPVDAGALVGISLATGIAAMAVTPDIVLATIDTYNKSARQPADLATLKMTLASQGFFKDIWRDYSSQNMDFHRIQNFCATLAIGLLFLTMSIYSAQYPNFGSLVGIMGLSSAGYIGFKYAND